jgi:hypothetical protein
MGKKPNQHVVGDMEAAPCPVMRSEPQTRACHQLARHGKGVPHDGAISRLRTVIVLQSASHATQTAIT